MMRRAIAATAVGVGLALMASLGSSLRAQTQETAASSRVSFTDDIRPIMERSCWNCHGEAAKLSQLDLSSRETALKGGTRGPALVPGRAEESRLYRMVAGLSEPPMPMTGGPLSDAELTAIRTWIDAGAHWDEGGVTSADAALSALENSELPPGARDYWAFKLPQRAAIPASETFHHPVDRFSIRRGSVAFCVQNRLREKSGHGKRLIDEIDLLTKEHSHDHSSQA